jgi:phage tail-like protein
MSAATRRDPLPVFCFKVQISIEGHKKAEAYFKSVSGLKYESEVVDYKEGGLNTTTHRLVGPIKWPNLVLKHGFTGTGPDAYSLLNWRIAWLDDKPLPMGGQPLKRAHGAIIQLRHDLTEVCQWTFRDGWPCKWEGPEYDGGKNELAIETLEIAHHGLEFTKLG